MLYKMSTGTGIAHGVGTAILGSPETAQASQLLAPNFAFLAHVDCTGRRTELSVDPLCCPHYLHWRCTSNGAFCFVDAADKDEIRTNNQVTDM